MSAGVDPLAGRPRSGPPKEWSIAMYRGPALAELRPVAAPALTAASVSDVEASFVADPFLFVERGRWHLFFELRNVATKKGEIAVATSADGVRWRYERVVLAEPFHLSYPHVFRAGGEIFMTPESVEARQVRLYRAIDFPFAWQFEATLIDGVYADPTVFRHGGQWWLFGCPWPMRHDALALFAADDVRGPWREHPKSPVVSGDRRRSRPAGPVRAIDGRLVRFAQDCEPAYGSGVRAFSITTLTATEYAEEEIAPAPILAASGSGWNRDGMHHIDLFADGGGWLACVDGYTVVPESPPRIEMLEGAEAADAIAAEWEILLEGTGAHRAFSSPHWHRDSRLFVARRYDRITGILPIAANQLADVNDVVAFDVETARHLLRAARERGPFELRCLRDDGLAMAALRGMPEAAIAHDADCYIIDLPATEREYLATRSHNFRKKLQQAERRAREAGAEVVELKDGDAIAELLVALNEARFGARSRLTTHAAFFARAFPPLFAGRRLRAWAVVRGGAVVALDALFESGGALHAWNGGFVPEAAELSPGHLLLAAEIRAAIAEGHTRFELLRGTHPYKAGWATGTRSLYRATVA